ncbi:hypothetical protein R1sor_000124 [Riccia sorocarpa]|uniref:Uncharacterized protein n=1 Tax=Riccia sorocarpa TaxID=122646 RepID=A0ABD3GV97_9MARC
METRESEVPDGIIDKIRYHIPFPEVYKRQKLDTRLEWPIWDRLHQVARKWPTYCPAFLQSGELFGFDRSSNSWHSVKLKHMQETEDKFVRVEAIEGALAVLSVGTRSSNFRPQALELWEGHTTGLRVVNLVSGKGRAISDAYPGSLYWLDFVRPARRHPHFEIPLLGKESFKVIVNADWNDEQVLWGSSPGLEIQIYSSQSDSWVSRWDKPDLFCRVLRRTGRLRYAFVGGSFFWVEQEKQVHERRYFNDNLIRVFAAVFESQFDDGSYHEGRWLLESLKAEFKPLDEMHVTTFEEPMLSQALESANKILPASDCETANCMGCVGGSLNGLSFFMIHRPLVFTESGFRGLRVSLPAVIQEYVDHGAHQYKMYLWEVNWFVLDEN